MLPDNLERKVHLLSADESVGFVHSGVETLVDESAPSAFADWIEDATDDTVWDGPEYFRILLLNGNRVCAPTVLARRHALIEQGGFDQDLGFACGLCHVAPAVSEVSGGLSGASPGPLSLARRECLARLSV